MILIDERTGSRELLTNIRSIGTDAEIAGQLAADFQFSGCGPDGSVLVGFERKTITDLFDSMRSGRLAGRQIGTMLQTYEVCYLVVEGYWRRGRGTGLVEIRNGEWRAARGNIRYSEVVRFLASLRELGDVRVWRTADEEETSAYICEEYAWWQKPYAEHRTARTIYAAEPKLNRKGHRPTVFRHEATLLEKWIVQLPGVQDRATEIAKYFSSPRDLADADLDRWLTIRGLRIGKKSARTIIEAINGS